MIWAILSLAMVADTPIGAEPSPEAVRFFETDVRPVLAEHCAKCHGPKKQWAGLRLDSRDALLRGGDSGPAIVPGSPDQSLLVRAIKHEDPNLRMPPETQLTPRQIADIARWIEWGAPLPELPTVRKRDPNHWAFRPPAHTPLRVIPSVAGQQSWPRSPIDSLILPRLDSHGLAPSPRADKRTLIRRMTFDLTGLPPGLDEIDTLIADQRDDAIERLVDRLLASPAYGERWGRHWLDVARYADSNGLDENIAHGNAWRFRDYVVDSLNRDKPFDRFLTEQLAGDLLPAESEPLRHELLTATGFLSIGPKVLAEVDQAKMRMDIVDEQIDSMGRAFLGMTFGCARCHDHKFDPIDAADYYGLAGMFKSTRTMDTYTKVAKWHENALRSPASDAMQAEYEARLADKKQAVQAFVERADRQARATVAPGTSPPEKLDVLYPAATKDELAKLRAELAELEKNPPELPAAMGVAEDQIVDVAIHVRGNPLKLGDVVGRRVPRAMSGERVPSFSPAESGRRQLAEWLVDPDHPLTSRVAVNRVWRWHFGKGLVRTTDNFGLLGETPTHPELLDWLARRFVADGWSLKTLHRVILSSSTYQQSSLADAEHLARDPENLLYGRADTRRLEAEAIRDSLLAVGEQLDRQFGGTLLKTKNRAYLFDHTSIDTTDYASRRRSLYLPVIRNHLHDLFQLLDFPDPAVTSGNRTTTTVAPQALLMMNSEFVMHAASDLAGRLWAESHDTPSRLARLYAIAYGREIRPDEIEANQAFLAETSRGSESTHPETSARNRHAWEVLCHVVLAANEFIYVP